MLALCQSISRLISSRTYRHYTATTAHRTACVAFTMNPVTPRVLSIQSHVVHGHVGNKCAVFPLQLLGFEVDFVNSVQFSNHSGYPSHTGTITSGDELWDLVEGMHTNDLLHYTHLLTGYIGSVSFLETIVKVVKRLRETNPDLIYVCDPVMGDEGRLYLAPELVPVYKNNIASLATILTPNQYEAELLSGVKIDSKQTALKACEVLHEQGTQTVVITSIQLKEAKEELLLIASTKVPQSKGSHASIQMSIPMIHAYFTGTGDLLTALLLAKLHQQPDHMQHAVEHAIASLQGVLLATVEAAGEAAHVKDRTEVCKARELRLIPNQHLLLDPEVKLKAEPL